jgi:hypothetical protein
MKNSWSFKQRFSLNASTMLLVFSFGLVGLAFSETLFDTFVRYIPFADEIFWRLGVNIERYLLISAIFSVFFLVRSIFKREPQVQFIIEIILAGLLYRKL